MISTRAIASAEADLAILVMLGSVLLTEALSQFLKFHGYQCYVGTSRTEPDVFIVDSSTIDDSLTLRHPEAKIFFLQMEHDPTRVASLLSWHKVHAIIPPSTGLQDFRKAVKAVRKGQFRVHHARSGALPGTEPPLPLTRQEKKVIACVCRGDSNNAIAQELHLSPHTVKAHVHNILRKTGAVNRTSIANLFTTCCTGGEDHE
jgi:DNA-binding NarL/FixJ family response regulator